MASINTGAVKDAVADTLFIPLYMRCLESRRGDGIIKDPEACRIVDAVDYDFSKYDGAVSSQVAASIRVRHFDAVTRRFLERNYDPVVVSLGCGLDTRSQRIGMNKGTFYNVDLPEVMALRDTLIAPDERNVSIHESMFDNSWATSIRDAHPESAFLVLVEGVFMYFSEDQVRSVIERIAKNFTPGELMIDACTSFACKNRNKHDTVKHTNAEFKWGMDDDALPEQWADNLSLMETTYYMNQERARWTWRDRIISFFPPIGKAFKMLHFSIGPKGE